MMAKCAAARCAQAVTTARPAGLPKEALPLWTLRTSPCGRGAGGKSLPAPRPEVGGHCTGIKGRCARILTRSVLSRYAPCAPRAASGFALDTASGLTGEEGQHSRKKTRRLAGLKCSQLTELIKFLLLAATGYCFISNKYIERSQSAGSYIHGSFS
nr:hypothetical protein [Pseudomonas syringae pv. actinidiae]